MKRAASRPAPRALAAGVALIVASAVACAVAGCGHSAASATTGAQRLRAPASPRALVRVGGDAAVAPTSSAHGFVGVAAELSSITALTGPPSDPDTPLASLLRNLSPGAPFSLRLGGMSTDDSWWPVPGLRRPGPHTYALTPRWAASVRGLLAAIGGKAILGVNLRSDSPRIAAAEVAAYERYIGANRIDAFEVGNEPEAYNLGVSGVFGHLHRLSFSRLFVRYGKRFGHVVAGLGAVPLAGPATGSPYWLPQLGTVLGDMPLRHLVLATIHEYALKACSGSAHLAVTDFFTHAAIGGLAASVHRAVLAAGAHGKPLRVAETNGDPCLGYPGVSNSFGEALWALNVLPALWRAGVQGVNIQRGQSGRYPNYNKFITASHSAAGWRVAVEPEYYGLLAFAQAAPAGSHLLRISASGYPGIYQFAVRAPDGSERVIVTDVGPTARTLAVSASGVHGPGSESLLTGPSLRASTGTTLGGESLSARTGQLAGPSHRTPVDPDAAGDYAIRVPAHAAAVLTVAS